MRARRSALGSTIHESKSHAGLSRKEFLAVLGLGSAAMAVGGCSRPESPGQAERALEALGEPVTPSVARVSQIIRAYDAQGIHRTGTEGDQECALWLAEEVRALGVEAELEGLAFERIDVTECHLQIGDRRFEAVPLFDAPPAGAQPIVGSVSTDLDSDVAIGFLAVPPNGRGIAELSQFRDTSRRQAVVAVTGGMEFGLPPGLALLNAEGYTAPAGPPTIQVGSEAHGALSSAQKSGREVRFVSSFRKVPTEVYNTTASVLGSNPALAPLVVMTPRSGWWSCASERGGGVAVWLETMRALAGSNPARSTHFVASTGHELGHYGLDSYLERRRAMIEGAVAWIHLGANFGAAVGGRVLFQSSDEEYRRLGLASMLHHGREPAAETAPGTRPLGEARNIFDGGGRYLSLLGSNGLFHHAEDRWPEAVDVEAVAGFAAAFADIAVELAGT